MPACFDPAKEAERRRKIGAANKGKLRPPELRARISASHKGKPKPWVSLALKGRKHPEGCTCGIHHRRGRQQSEEQKRKVSLALMGHPGWTKGIHWSAESNRKRSESNTKAIMEGRHPYKRYKLGRITTLKGGTFWCRSSWEVRYARMLDKDPEVIEFSYEGINVPYIYRGEQHYTVPDFLVRYADGKITVDEIKPGYKVNSCLKDRLKMIAMQIWAERWGFAFRWWNGESYIDFQEREIAKIKRE